MLVKYTWTYIKPQPPPNVRVLRPLVEQRLWVATARLALWRSIASELVCIAHQKRWLRDRVFWKMHDVQARTSKKNHINLDAEWPLTYVTKEHINRHTCMILASKDNRELILFRLENPKHDWTASDLINYFENRLSSKGRAYHVIGLFLTSRVSIMTRRVIIVT